MGETSDLQEDSISNNLGVKYYLNQIGQFSLSEMFDGWIHW